MTETHQESLEKKSLILKEMPKISMHLFLHRQPQLMHFP